ncbi:hypothetical protein ABVT39_017926 [Epinephelus coioides]
MLAVYESCLPTLSKLRESISGLQADLKERDKILLDFTTVATTQAKHIAHLTASGAGDQSVTATNNTTLPWTGSITTRTPTPALAESRWHRQGAKPKSSALSTTFAPQSRSASSWRVEQEHRPGIGVCLSSLTPPFHPGQEEPRPGATNIGLHPVTIVPPGSRRHALRSSAPLCASDRDLHEVEVHNGRTFCHPGARVSEFASSALQLTARHSLASTLVLEAGINDLRNQQSEVLKQDFISLVDRLLDTGKRLIMSGPLPAPCYGDVTTSRLCRLHLWLKGHCLSKSYISVSASVGNMVLISADRYIAICDPMFYSTKVTVKRVQLCICLCWIFSAVHSSWMLRDLLKQPGRHSHFTNRSNRTFSARFSPQASPPEDSGRSGPRGHLPA